MSLCTRISRFGRNVLIGGTLLGAVLFGAKANAEDVKPQKEPTPIIATTNKTLENKVKRPKRRAILDLTKSPLDDFDANAKIWYSINQLLGKGSDLLARELKLDNSIFGRLGQIAVFAYLNNMTEYYSHELAHDYEIRKMIRAGELKGCSEKTSINWSDWHMGCPAYNQTGHVYYVHMAFDITSEEDDEKAYVRTITNGLNQDELDAALVHRESVLKKNLTFDEAISYLIPKNLDLGYILISTKGGLNYKADYKPINEIRSKFFPSIDSQGLWNDIDMYLHHLHRKGLYRAKKDDPYNYYAFGWKEGMNLKGIELSKKELFFQALIADAFSIKTYDSAMSLYNYIVKGERNTKPFTFKLGRTEITPPQISHFLTKDGSFYDTNAFFNIAGKMLFEANLGTDVDFIGHGKVRHLRTGGQLHMLNKGISIRPFLYLNSTRGKVFAYKGIASGLEMAIGDPDVFEIFAKIGFHENDLIENDIKGKPNGVDLSVGFNITY